MGEYAAANTLLCCRALLFLRRRLGSNCVREHGKAIMTLQRPDRGPQRPEWTAVYITHNVHEAHIIVGMLRAHDVPAMLQQEAVAAAIGITLGKLGEVKVLVSPADFDRAAALLDPAASERIEANNDRIQLIWPDDAAPELDDDDE